MKNQNENLNNIDDGIYDVEKLRNISKSFDKHYINYNYEQNNKQILIIKDDWARILLNVPKEFEHLVRLCDEFEKINLHIAKITPYISGEEIAQVQILIHRLISDVFSLLNRKNVSDKVMKDLRDDVVKSLRRYYTADGMIMDISSQFQDAKEKGTIDIFTATFLAPARTYIKRIYDSLLYAKENSDAYFTKLFMSNFCDRAGTVLDISMKKRSEDFEISDKEEKKKEKEK